MRTLAIIPARGGSKGVPRKNIRQLGGRPLIEWSIRSALAAGDALTRIIVSTDDVETAAIARSAGAEVPFMRPPELSGDKVPTLPVLQHAVAFAENEEGQMYDLVMLLQPTAPFRTAQDIRDAVHLAATDNCDSVISVVQVFAVHPILMKRIEGERLMPFCIEEREGTRRQDYSPAAFMRNGAIYLTRRHLIIEQGTIWGRQIRPLVMPEERSASIDSEHDFAVCEAIWNRRGHNDHY
jgi:CMP-N,N'-diacetyllegionaminic acid synthase